MAVSSISNTRRTISLSIDANHPLLPSRRSWLWPPARQDGIPNAAWRPPARSGRTNGGPACDSACSITSHDLTRQRDYADLLDELRELAAICDETDFDVFWMPEHHFSVWGRELLPNPLMTAVDLAARTKRIRIGLAAAIVTFWHPLRAAEDIALLDQLTRRAAWRSASGGAITGWRRATSIPSRPERPGEEQAGVRRGGIGDQGARSTQERFSFKGQVYQFPAPGFSADRAHTVNDPDYIDPVTGELIKLSIYPRARQQPLPMWEVVNSLDFDPARGTAGPWDHHVASAGGGVARAAARVSGRAARGHGQGPAARRARGDHARYLRGRQRGGGGADRGRADDGLAQLLQLARARAFISIPARRWRPSRKRR